MRCFYPYYPAALQKAVFFMRIFLSAIFQTYFPSETDSFAAVSCFVQAKFLYRMTVNTSPCQTEQELIERYGAIALEKQVAFYQIIGNKPWHINIEGSHIVFGGNLVCPIQVIGSYLPERQAWLYAWANPESAFPEAVLAHAKQLKEYGERYNNDFLRYHGFQATEADLHKIGLIASGMFQATGYFIATLSDNTALLLTLYNAYVPNRTKEDLGAIPDIFPAICNLYPMNQRNAFIQYLTAKAIDVTEEDDLVKGTKNDFVFTAKFDPSGRMTDLSIR